MFSPQNGWFFHRKALYLYLINVGVSMMHQIRRFLLFSIIILAMASGGILSCGIPSDFIFNEPLNIRTDLESGVQMVKLQVENNEFVESTEGQIYLLVGYNVYYSFGGTRGFQKASVLGLDDKLGEENVSTRINFNELRTIDNLDTTTDHGTDLREALRFPDGPENWPSGNPDYRESDLGRLYESVTIPVTIQQIVDITSKGNADNLWLTFDNVAAIADPGIDYPNLGTRGQLNPKSDSGTSPYLLCEKVGPNYNRYKGYSWYKKDDFKGIYDQAYIDHIVNSEGVTDIDGKNDVYLLSIYVTAVGFNDEDERFPQGLIESLPSDTVTLEIDMN
jgi:hypothetical protein